MSDTKLKLNKELSNIPSKLLTQALDDLKFCEQNSKVKIDMSYWCNNIDEICNVCLAGSVIYNNNNDEEISKHPRQFCYKDEKKLLALNSFRVGGVKLGLFLLGIENTCIDDRCVSLYHEDSKKFYKDMYKLVKDLKKVGL